MTALTRGQPHAPAPALTQPCSGLAAPVMPLTPARKAAEAAAGQLQDPPSDTRASTAASCRQKSGCMQTRALCRLRSVLRRLCSAGCALQAVLRRLCSTGCAPRTLRPAGREPSSGRQRQSPGPWHVVGHGHRRRGKHLGCTGHYEDDAAGQPKM